MIVSALRWLGRNLGTLLMAFILALIVWVSAKISEDPNQEDILQRQIPIEKIGLNPELLIMGSFPTNIRLTIDAPGSVWRELRNNENSVRAWVDLSGLGPGDYVRPVQVQFDPTLRSARVVAKEPDQVQIRLEKLVTQTYSITLDVNGTPALGYEVGTTVITPTQVTVSGAESLVNQVKEINASLNIAGASQTINTSLPLRALDADGRTVAGVSVIPEALSIKQPIKLLGGYRNVIVRVVTIGQVANGYKITNIVVTPTNLVVFSSNPSLLNQLPGYVDTQPLDLNGAQDYLETPLGLNLPQGILAVNDQKVLVQVFIAPIESNLTVTLPVEVIGLKPGLAVQVAPTTVDIILSGPLPVLNTLKPSDFRVVVDLSGLDIGTHPVEPKVSILPPRVKLESILPATLEVTIVLAPTPTVTVTPIPQPTPTLTPRP